MKLTLKQVAATHRVLIYGPPKTGKSELAGRLSQFKKLLWFDLENGYTTLLKLPEEWKERIEIISVPDTKSNPMAIDTCLKVVRGGPVEICEDHGRVACPTCKKNTDSVFTRVCLNELDESTVVVFDSLTQLTSSAIAHITKSQPEDYKMEFGDWANLGKLMESFLSHVQQASYNVVCISHETEAELEDGKIKLVPVAGTRAFSRNTAKYFDHVVYAEVKNKKHSFYSSTTSANNLNTGSRTGIVLESIAGSPLMALFGTAQVAQVTTPTAVATPQAKPEAVVQTDKLASILAGLKKPTPTSSPAPTPAYVPPPALL